MTVDDCQLDRHDRTIITFSGVKRFTDVYEWLFNHYNGYKFGIVLDCSLSEYPEPDSKIYVHFLDELMDEVAMEAGYVRYDKDTYKHR